MPKMNLLRPALAAALVAAALPAALAAQARKTAPPAPEPVTIACPVGGKEFRFKPPGRTAVLGFRADGKPYSAAPAPAPLAECPDNGLVLFKELTAEEAAQLEPLLASEAYKALLKSDTSYYRAHWLMREMGVEPKDYLFVLLQAAWQADAKPELRARYLAEFAEGTGKLDPAPADLNWIGMEARAVNALRELGRFDEASARLEKIPVAILKAASADKAEQARRRAWLEYLADLKTVIAREDASLEPVEMIPRRVAQERCGADAEAAKTELCVKFAEEELKRVAAPREQSGR